jgi:prepilin peptidase CpaA
MPIEILLLAFAGLMVAAAMSDAVRFIIPNWLCGAVALLFPAAALVAGLEWPLIGMHLLAGVLALVIGFALFAPGWIGGGDAKLLAAAALWFGWQGLFPFLLSTVLAGGVLVLLLIALRRCVPMFQSAAGRLENTALAQGAPVPYGIAIAAGALWSLPGSVLAAGV